jgi:predicted O-linked N-acetylglucosamine transferase (SPINDLY family)
MDDFTDGLTAEIEAASEADLKLDLAHVAEIAPPFPFEVQYLDGNPRALKEAYAAIFSQRMPQPRDSQWIDSWRGPRECPRVGFVVTEGHEGVFLKTLGAIIERFTDQWELMVFCSRRGASRVRAEINRDKLRVVSVPMRCDQIAECITESRCDLLYHYEVGTDSINYFLPFLRLAPVQVTSWGVQLTSGIPNLDAYLSSELIEPSDAQDFYTEQLCLTRKTLLTFRHRTELPSVVCNRDHFAIPSDAHWYVCAQQLGKIHVDFDQLLAGILRRDPRGIVVLTGDKYGHYAKRLRQRLETLIPDVAQRVHLLPRLDQHAYLSLLYHAEVLLDPPHFAGGNSTYDGLSLGKPIVTRPSPYQRGRYTLGCYRQMRFVDCVVETANQYIELAVRLGIDPDFRHSVSARLLAASHVLFEDHSVVSEHERIFRELLYQSKSCRRHQS